jgi:hypothetical protein
VEIRLKSLACRRVICSVRRAYDARDDVGIVRRVIDADGESRFVRGEDATSPGKRVPFCSFDIHLDEIDATEIQLFGDAVERDGAHSNTARAL